MKLPPIAYVTFGGLLGVVGLVTWNAGHSSPPSQPPAITRTVTPDPRAFLPPITDTSLTTTSPSNASDEPPGAVSPIFDSERKAALVDLDNIQFMLRDFRAIMHGNPEGTNAEIMKSIMGGNRNNAQLGPPQGQRVNEQGELVDRWGTPYFFHQLSKEEMEVRSAGPDRKLWTTDDVVMK
jgi:hypothetical protein